MPRRIRFSALRALAAILLLALVAACGGGDDAKGGDGGDGKAAPDACTLVTKAEAEQALGKEVVGPRKTDQDGDRCTYDSGLSRVSVVVLSDPRSASELESETAPGEKVEGIGDAAYFYQSLGELHVVVGSRSFAVGVLVNGAQRPEVARTLAEAAAARF